MLTLLLKRCIIYQERLIAHLYWVRSYGFISDEPLSEWIDSDPAMKCATYLVLYSPFSIFKFETKYEDIDILAEFDGCCIDLELWDGTTYETNIYLFRKDKYCSKILHDLLCQSYDECQTSGYGINQHKCLFVKN